MRCYSNKFVHDIHFDKTRYQQFLREQGLSEHAIKHLNILFITDFTHSHFRGSPTFTDGGAFFQRDREYVAKMNEWALGLYRPYYPSRAYAAIFLRPKRYETPVYLNQIFLNETLLHETRHHIQYCLNLPCSKPVDDAPVDGNALNERNRPWEIDAERFAAEYVNQVSFFLPVSRPLTRSDLL
jgi:hypothetical protein